MQNLELISKPETFEQLFSRIEILKKQFSDIGILLNRMPIDEKIRVYNTAEPPAMQFKPKNIEEMQKLAAEVKETAGKTSLHLPNPKFNEEIGTIEQKEEIIKMLKQETENNFNLVTTHLGWKNADLILDEQGKWQKTDLANKMASELADLFIAGIESGKTMTIENVGYNSKFRETLGTRPEHLIAARDKMAQIIAAKKNMPVDEILSKIGYAFDVGHVVKNTRLLEQCSVEAWLEQLGKNIRIMHIHDVLPPMEILPTENETKYKREQRDHKPLGEGIIDWKSFFQLKNKYCSGVPMILEINPIDDETGAGTIKSVDYLEKLKQ